MDSLYTYIVPIILSSLFSIGAFVMKNIFKRLEILEDKLDKAVTEQNVRALLADKIDPIKEDVGEIKQALIKIYELYLNERKK